MPTGGVNLQNAGEFIKAGAAAIAAGGEMVDKKAVAEKKFSVITENARKFLAEVSQGARQGLKRKRAGEIPPPFSLAPLFWIRSETILSPKSFSEPLRISCDPKIFQGGFLWATWILISVFGRDRPGIVANVSRVLYRSGCNIEELSQTAIKGQFAMILIASTSQPDSLAGLKDEVRMLSSELDLEINLRKINEVDMAPFDFGETEPYILTVRGEDRPGLVYGITEVLAERGINITNLDAKTARVGEKLEYIQLFEVDIPKKLDYGWVQEKLRARGKEMGVEVDLQHRGIFRAMNQI